MYRRTRERMPAHDFEVEEAEEEGVLMRWLSTIKQADEGKLVIERMELDETGFPQPTGELEELEADSVVLALGQDTDLSLLDGVAGIEVEDGVVKVGPDMMTGHDGDLRRRRHGARRAHRDGRRRARQEGGAPHRRLAARARAYEPAPKHELATFDMLNTWYYADAPRTEQPHARAGPARRATFDEVVGGPRRGRTRCSRRAAASPAGPASRATTATASAPTTRSLKLGEPGERYEIDLDYCKGCGICVSECPSGAIKMVPETI